MYYHNKVNRVDNIDWRNPGSSGEKVKSDGNSAQQIREAAKLLRDLRYGQTKRKRERDWIDRTYVSPKTKRDKEKRQREIQRRLEKVRTPEYNPEGENQSATPRMDEIRKLKEEGKPIPQNVSSYDPNLPPWVIQEEYQPGRTQEKMRKDPAYKEKIMKDLGKASLIHRMDSQERASYEAMSPEEQENYFEGAGELYPLPKQQPAATQPAATQPAATQPDATQPDATQPAVVPPAEPGSSIDPGTAEISSDVSGIDEDQNKAIAGRAKAPKNILNLYWERHSAREQDEDGGTSVDKDKKNKKQYFREPAEPGSSIDPGTAEISSDVSGIDEDQNKKIKAQSKSVRYPGDKPDSSSDQLFSSLEDEEDWYDYDPTWETIEKEHRTMEREDFADQPGVQVGSPMDILKDKENDKFEELKILQEILENFEGSEDEYKKLMGQYWPLAEELMKEFGTE